MKGFSRPWFIVGGWSIDLFLDRLTREHHDIEIGIFRRDQQSLGSYLGDWTQKKIVNFQAEPWNRPEVLPLPIHELHFYSKSHCRLEILLQESEGNSWRYRREGRITLPMAEAIQWNSSGIPFLAPQIVLLYKACDTRPKDAQDFAQTLPFLNGNQREWLARALETAHPQHSWITELSN